MCYSHLFTLQHAAMVALIFFCELVSFVQYQVKMLTNEKH